MERGLLQKKERKEGRDVAEECHKGGLFYGEGGRGRSSEGILGFGGWLRIELRVDAVFGIEGDPDEIEEDEEEGCEDVVEVWS